MLLRASGQETGTEYDLDGISDGDVRKSGVPHGQLLVNWASAVSDLDVDETLRLAAQVRNELGEEGLVDAAGVVGTFTAIGHLRIIIWPGLCFRTGARRQPGHTTHQQQ